MSTGNLPKLENIDKAIESMIKDPKQKKNGPGIVDLHNLFSEPTAIAKEKLRSRLKAIKEVAPSNPRLNMPTSLAEFKSACIQWIENLLLVKEIDKETFGDEFQITESGDIFKGEYKARSGRHTGR